MSDLGETDEAITVEGIMAEFVGDIGRAIKKHWPGLQERGGFTAAHMIIGGLEQAQQKVIRELEIMLEEVLEEKYFYPDR